MHTLPPRPVYSDEEEGTWRLLHDRQTDKLASAACRPVLDGLRLAGFEGQRIPSLRTLSANLQRLTGWQLTRVEGLVAERPFFELVASRRFPATDFIRKRKDLDYTPAPDLFHDQFGHVPLLTLPTFCRFFQRFGLAGQGADDDAVEALARIYWFTVEFGLIRQDGELKAFGAGLVSSIGELDHALSPSVTVHPFDLDAMAARPFVTTEIQADYFEVPSFEALEQAFDAWAVARGLLPPEAAKPYE
ncbi:MAG: phenylalanine 4-monooxygenase [Myxococcales bacterium]|nr:phenylalanine 4-monooxygenase [Myxococcales bacterium]